MNHRLKPSQYAILLTVMLTASVGDTLLSRGMSQVGAVDLPGDGDIGCLCSARAETHGRTGHQKSLHM